MIRILISNYCLEGWNLIHSEDESSLLASSALLLCTDLGIMFSIKFALYTPGNFLPLILNGGKTISNDESDLIYIYNFYVKKQF